MMLQAATMSRPIRTLDTHRLFQVCYADGRYAYIRVRPQVAEGGSLRLMQEAHLSQERGEIPDGAITSVKRVR